MKNKSMRTISIIMVGILLSSFLPFVFILDYQYFYQDYEYVYAFPPKNAPKTDKTINETIIHSPEDKNSLEMDKETSSISGDILNIVEGASINGNPNYQPKDLTVKQGNIITINNLDSTIHTVSHGKPNNLNSSVAFDSGIISSGESSELDTSNIPIGSFEYYCVFHPYMMGKLRIQ